jgi:predicted aldo/keto reductase-like oxidoreductase
MEQRRLGRTGLQVSAIGFGAARLDEHPDRAVETVHRALGHGVNFIDTARYYGNSEAHLGEALRERRREVALATKALIEDPDTTRQSFETSLALLRLDGVDLLYAHACDTEERFTNLLRRGGALDQLRKIQAEGMTRFIGVSFNHFLPFENGRSGLDRMKALIETGAFDVIQVPMSLIRIERVEDEVLPLAAERDLGVVINFPTADGLLTRDVGVFQPLFDPYVSTPCQAALLALLLYPEVTSVLSGMSLPAIADENCAVGRIIAGMAAEERIALRRRVAAVGVGPCRSCGRCEPYTHGVPVRRIMTYYDAATRYGLEKARACYEGHRDQVLACTSFEGADAVCPEGFDVLATVRRVFESQG